MRKYPSSPQVDPQLLRIFQNGTPFSVPYPTMTTAVVESLGAAVLWVKNTTSIELDWVKAFIATGRAP
eukprot:gnl/Chilomastix_caulleri/4784.p1 GENE.gnl/Chilomastix_caulleri/4784~~gnl/Chilomastix_caulleri/4784.p1  ORF type:complete len:68 (-),score=4.48 gnl/Chilomastix_caulleri/4784:111-314(-)